MSTPLELLVTSSNNAPSTPLPVLVCFSHLRWSFVHQRPQHLLARAAVDHRVYFIEEPVFEGSGPTGRLDIHQDASGVTVVVPVLFERSTEADRMETQRLLLDQLLLKHSGEELIFWYYTPMALDFSDHIRPDLCVYDCMDELTAFRGAPPRLGVLERRLFQRSSIVFTGGWSLYEAKRDKHANVHAFPSSIDVRHFARARRTGSLREPADQQPLRRPRIGFFGVIDERLDLNLIASVAALRPDWEFVFLGPVVKIEPCVLPHGPNLHWLGSKCYSDLPAYLAHWDAGFMPFAINEATRFISPTKTPEFLAAGVPVVSTPIRDVVRPYGQLGVVEIASNAEETVEKLEAVLERETGAWLQQVDRHLAGSSWDKTWAGMRVLMQQSASDGLRSQTGGWTRPSLAESATRV
jgi:glycosyltransferase involved in cell wall biosynthesis